MCPIPCGILVDMGRRRRPYLPGGIFHLTARTLRREHRFTPRLRSATIAAIAGATERSGGHLLAVAVMSNHLHIIYQQGDRPLSALMQPLLRRLAHRIQNAHDLEGPVFWRPYGCRACLDPSHARNAIVYTHLNPLRAGVVADPSRYAWTSHALYATRTPGRLPAQLEPLRAVLDPRPALGLFSTAAERTTDERRIDYCAFVDWRIGVDRAQDDDTADDPAWVPHPPSPWQDTGALWSLSPLFHTPVRTHPGDVTGDPSRPIRHLPDLATLAQTVLDAEAPGLPLERIRGRRGGTRAIRLRHMIIRRLHAAGFRNVQIAQFLGLSESGVSYVLCKRPERS